MSITYTTHQALVLVQGSATASRCVGAGATPVTNWEGQIALYLEGHGMRDEDIETVIEACRIDPGRRDELLRLASSPWGAGWWRILGQRGFNEPEIH